MQLPVLTNFTSFATPLLSVTGSRTCGVLEDLWPPGITDLYMTQLPYSSPLRRSSHHLASSTGFLHLCRPMETFIIARGLQSRQLWKRNAGFLQTTALENTPDRCI
jgi:hypothetical protein